jgi:hypothetical protein
MVSVMVTHHLYCFPPRHRALLKNRSSLPTLKTLLVAATSKTTMQMVRKKRSQSQYWQWKSTAMLPPWWWLKFLSRT